MPSSGNTGIAVAALAARLGHPTTVTMPEDSSPERVRMLHLIGAHARGIRTIAVEPPEGERVDGVRRRQAAEAMPLFGRWRGADIIEDWHTASRGESRRCVLRLARECGVFGGPSTGLALAGAIAVAGCIDSGTVAFIACDGPWKYLSEITLSAPLVRTAA